MKKDPEQGKMDPKLRNQLIYLIAVLFVALIAAIAGSVAVARQQSRVPWAVSQKTSQTTVSVQATEDDDDDIDAVSDSVDFDNAAMAQTERRTTTTMASASSSTYHYQTYSYQYATEAYVTGE